MIKRNILLALIIIMLFSSISFANFDRVFTLGILGQGGANLEEKLTRDQLATVSVRLMGLEYLKDNYNKKGNFKDVRGWPLPYVNIAYEYNIMSGVSKDTFNPNGDVNYVQLLTILMRLLGYKDNIDFTKYPDDYYAKALEIGLGDLYIPYDEIINREIAANTIEKFFDLKIKDNNISYYESMKNRLKPYEIVPEITKSKNITMDNIVFNTSIVGSFSGVLKGDSDFSKYKVGIYSRNGTLYKMVSPKKNGEFNIIGFDNSIVAQLSKYEYRVYNRDMNLVLSGNLN